ncbi:MAG TPA: preprotein translocase subunit SecE [Burkholderiaceae bacterium]|nr:preprotein translocase subunit SecE [Burkholderiaceae bacterium]
MATQQIQTVGSRLDTVLSISAVVAVVAGVLGFSFLSGQTTLIRVAVLAGGLVLGLVLGWLSLPGRQFLAFSRESYDEARRVVWPSRKETVQTTAVVFVFVVVMALFLFFVDKTVEWVLYDLLLRWK